MTSVRSSTLARRAATVCGVAIATIAATASAQTDVARAENLFIEGKALLEAKKFEQACPMFAESARLDPSSGVELALGYCYEGQGKIASAWGAYSAAAGLARRDARHDREAAATERVRALELMLPRVTFVVAPESSSLAGVELLQDGALLAAVSWTDSPVDPGTHSLQVRAPGRVTFATTFVVKAAADRVTVPVPPLALIPVAPTVLLPAPTPVAPPGPLPRPSTPWRTVGFALVGTSATSVVVASILGGVAIGKANTVNKACPSSPCANSGAVSDNGTAGTLADASTGLFIAGGALAAGGVALLLLAPRHVEAPSSGATSFKLRPTLAPGYVGIEGSF